MNHHNTLAIKTIYHFKCKVKILYNQFSPTICLPLMV